MRAAPTLLGLQAIRRNRRVGCGNLQRREKSLMKLQYNGLDAKTRLPRRSFLLASALAGGAIRALAEPPSGAGLPAGQGSVSGAGDQEATRTATKRLVRHDSSQAIRLRPVSRDFTSTLVQAIAMDPRGELVAVAGDDHAIRIMETSSLKLLGTLQGHSDLIQTLDFDPQGNRLVSAGNDGQLILWDRRASFRVIQKMQGTPALACVRFSPDGNEIAAVGFNERVYLIGGAPGGTRPQVECDCTDLRAVEYGKDGKILAVAGRSGGLHLFERPSYQLLGDYQIHSGRIHAIRSVDESPVVVSAGEDGYVVMFDTDAKRIVRRIRVTSGKLFCVCILDKQHLAVAGSDNQIRIVNVTQGSIVDRLDGHTGSIATLAATGNLLFSGGYDATLRRWQISGLEGHSDRIAERDPALDR